MVSSASTASPTHLQKTASSTQGGATINKRGLKQQKKRETTSSEQTESKNPTPSFPKHFGTNQNSVGRQSAFSSLQRSVQNITEQTNSSKRQDPISKDNNSNLIDLIQQSNQQHATKDKKQLSNILKQQNNTSKYGSSDKDGDNQKAPKVLDGEAERKRAIKTQKMSDVVGWIISQNQNTSGGQYPALFDHQNQHIDPVDLQTVGDASSLINSENGQKTPHKQSENHSNLPLNMIDSITRAYSATSRRETSTTGQDKQQTSMTTDLTKVSKQGSTSRNKVHSAKKITKSDIEKFDNEQKQKFEQKKKKESQLAAKNSESENQSNQQVQVYRQPQEDEQCEQDQYNSSDEEVFEQHNMFRVVKSPCTIKKENSQKQGLHPHHQYHQQQQHQQAMMSGVNAAAAHAAHPPMMAGMRMDSFHQFYQPPQPILNNQHSFFAMHQQQSYNQSGNEQFVQNTNPPMPPSHMLHLQQMPSFFSANHQQMPTPAPPANVPLKSRSSSLWLGQNQQMPIQNQQNIRHDQLADMAYYPLLPTMPENNWMTRHMMDPYQQMFEEHQMIKVPLPPLREGDSPIFVNPKQANRIMIMRKKRAEKLAQQGYHGPNRYFSAPRRKYDSRVRVAKDRKRMKNGQFLPRSAQSNSNNDLEKNNYDEDSNDRFEPNKRRKTK